MRLEKLLEAVKETGFEVLQGTADPEAEITALVNDSRKTVPGSMFVCIRGAVSDGHSYAAQVAQAGAAVIIAEQDLPEVNEAGNSVVVIRVPDTRLALALLSAAWFDHPAEKLKTIGITGTKGKTTTTYLVKSVLEHLGLKVGLVGTIEIIIGEEHIHASNTTPESYQLQEYFSRMVQAGLDVVVMEVSSQAELLSRVAGITFDYGVFTNLEPDHIGPNEHSSFEEYLECKAKLFRHCRIGIGNGDDAHFAKVFEKASCSVETFGLEAGRDLRGTDLKLTDRPGELGVSFRTEGLISLNAHIPTPGRFSVYNALTAIAICRHFGASEEDIRTALGKAKVKGRIEMVPVSPDFTLMIDYAHNAMALESLLSTLKEYHPGRLVCVFGCGGNRSKSRRFEMGEVSGKMADFTIITSDNPRFEKPLDIIADIRTGIEKTDGEFIEIPDRKEAIRYAIRNGLPGDIIVLAGKGHEDYQEIEGVKYPMDERELIREILEEEK